MDDIVWSKKHPFFKDCEYLEHTKFRNDGLFCRVEKYASFSIFNVYRVVFYTKKTRFGVVKYTFSLKGAINLKDNVFENRHSYGFE
jgi:hypothetical protein